MSTKRHGVPEYDKADLDEPLFVLRAQDLLAPVVVQLYALHCTTKGVNRTKVISVRKCAAEMRAWQEVHGSKVPD